MRICRSPQAEIPFAKQAMNHELPAPQRKTEEGFHHEDTKGLSFCLHVFEFSW
jgi:hypothetical protein